MYYFRHPVTKEIWNGDLGAYEFINLAWSYQRRLVAFNPTFSPVAIKPDDRPDILSYNARNVDRPCQKLWRKKEAALCAINNYLVNRLAFHAVDKFPILELIDDRGLQGSEIVPYEFDQMVIYFTAMRVVFGDRVVNSFNALVKKNVDMAEFRYAFKMVPKTKMDWAFDSVAFNLIVWVKSENDLLYA